VEILVDQKKNIFMSKEVANNILVLTTWVPSASCFYFFS
jgi:hypothetical protein